MRSLDVTFDCPDADAELRLVREYLTDAFDRFEECPEFDTGYFWRHGNAAEHETDEPEGHQVLDGGVHLVVNGADPESVIDRERKRWAHLEERGIITGVEARDYRPDYENNVSKMADNHGQEPAELMYRLRQVTTRTSLDLAETLDEYPPAVTERDDATNFGFWMIIHYLFKGNGYDWDDEMAACRQAIQNRVRSMALFTDRETALKAFDAELRALKTFREEFAATSGTE